ncbi:hypothetical protein [Nostoc sp. UHCC 0870]|uniref:hypothetical protein n=1 Tax=Nostoc sp. UHCC 0870 TaxID=2914041 RepID=UPI001EDE1535|nr:hypothetical protein [Nostoc sp. UHCC 0870]UKO97447.1 hypothetical protein L6494_23190 [Nostoc sp. UHCC 0870]
MARYRVVCQQIDLPDLKIIAEAKAFDKSTGNATAEIHQDVSVIVASGNRCSGYIKSSCSKSSNSGSSSSSVSISQTH